MQLQQKVLSHKKTIVCSCSRTCCYTVKADLLCSLQRQVCCTAMKEDSKHTVQAAMMLLLPHAHSVEGSSACRWIGEAAVVEAKALRKVKGDEKAHPTSIHAIREPPPVKRMSLILLLSSLSIFLLLLSLFILFLLLLFPHHRNVAESHVFCLQLDPSWFQGKCSSPGCLFILQCFTH